MPLADEAWRDLDPWAKARLRWRLTARENQLTPEGAWRIWLLLAGRNWGKTRTGAEDISEYARTHPDARIAIVAGDFADGRDICIEGESGILSFLPRELYDWNRSMGEISFANGAHIKLFGAEKPDDLRGPHHHRAWCDELAKWRFPVETWQQLMLGLTLGDMPQAIVTTTPKPLGILFDLVAREGEDVIVTRGATFENAENLSDYALTDLRRQYEGSQLGRQELYAELLVDLEGALWKRAWIDETRVVPTALPPLTRIAVGVDPSTWGPESGLQHESAGQGIETGLVVVGMDKDGDCYVLDDKSCRASPMEWARKTVDLWREHKATAIVPEKNVGGWVVSTIQAAAETRGESVSFAKDKNGRPGVSATQGKRARAEPVAAYYEKRKVHHVGTFEQLEDAMCSWDPTENWSPDRIDALVWAITWLEPWKRRMSMTSGRQVADARI